MILKIATVKKFPAATAILFSRIWYYNPFHPPIKSCIAQRYTRKFTRDFHPMLRS